MYATFVVVHVSSKSLIFVWLYIIN